MTEKAKDFAFKAHGKQLYGTSPYSIHLHDVVNITVRAHDPVLHPGFLEEVAWLHDVLEDTEVTAEELEEKFGSFVTRSVQMITDPPDVANRKARKTRANATFAILSVEDITERAALIVKTADRLANITHSNAVGDEGKLKMYRLEHVAFKLAVKRSGLLPSFWERMESKLGLIGPNNT